MDWLGIGVLVIGIALLIIAIVLIKPLNKVSDLIDSTKATTDKLPQTLDNITGQAEDVLQKANTTLSEVNGKVAQLTPMFEILGDAGRASREISSSAVEATLAMKNSTAEGREITDEKGLHGVYGGLALAYYLYEKRKAMKQIIQEAK